MHWYIYRIFSFENIGYFRYIWFLWSFCYIFNVTDHTLWLYFDFSLDFRTSWACRICYFVSVHFTHITCTNPKLHCSLVQLPAGGKETGTRILWLFDWLLLDDIYQANPVLRNSIEIAVTIRHRPMLKLKCTKFDFGWDSAPDPLGELTAFPQAPYSCI